MSRIRPKAGGLERGGELLEPGVAAEFGVDLAVIDDVVAVRAAGPSAENRRGVGVADAQLGEVRNDAPPRRGT